MGNKKRIFFGFQIHSPWPSNLPKGRVLEEEQRHMTVAFLGETEENKIKELTENLPLPDFEIGFSGKFDGCIFLPEKNPNVAAWHIDWYNLNKRMLEYQEQLRNWLIKNNYMKEEKREFTPHSTITRKPFEPLEWKKQFTPLPLVSKDLHLYESLGNSKYKKIWTHSLGAPFQEIEHTADIAYQVKGYSFPQLFLNAFTALAFRTPEFLRFYPEEQNFESIDEVIIGLNRIVTTADQEIGSSLKAVSYHGEAEKQGSLLNWEMIIDV